MNIILLIIGNITSPTDTSHPSVSKYPNGVECIWLIETDPGFHLEIQFYGRFEIEQSEGCTNDYLMVGKDMSHDYYMTFIP